MLTMENWKFPKILKVMQMAEKGHPQSAVAFPIGPTSTTYRIDFFGDKLTTEEEAVGLVAALREMQSSRSMMC
jgi:hypothetical protein